MRRPLRNTANARNEKLSASSLNGGGETGNVAEGLLGISRILKHAGPDKPPKHRPKNRSIANVILQARQERPDTQPPNFLVSLSRRDDVF